MPRETMRVAERSTRKACTQKFGAFVGLETAPPEPAGAALEAAGSSQAGARAAPLAALPCAATLPQLRPHADFTTGTSPPDGPFPEPMSVPRGEGWPGAALTGIEDPSALGITAGT